MTDPFAVGKTALYGGPRAVDASYVPAGGGAAVPGLRVILETRDRREDSGGRGGGSGGGHRVRSKGMTLRVLRSAVALVSTGGVFTFTDDGRTFEVLREPLSEDDPQHLDWVATAKETTP